MDIKELNELRKTYNLQSNRIVEQIIDTFELEEAKSLMEKYCERDLWIILKKRTHDTQPEVIIDDQED